MRTGFGGRRGFATVRRHVCMVTAIIAVTMVQDRSLAAAEWPRTDVKNPVVAEALRAALDGVSRWLAAAKCRALTSEFQNAYQQPLDSRLSQLNMSLETYLRAVVFTDGSLRPQCARDKRLAFTAQGSRVVFVCGREFERASRERPELARATIIHETLHTLGLGENPPSSQEITRRVLELCEP